jgi:hypothetical protein
VWEPSPIGCVARTRQDARTLASGALRVPVDAADGKGTRGHHGPPDRSRQRPEMREVAGGSLKQDAPRGGTGYSEGGLTAALRLSPCRAPVGGNRAVQGQAARNLDINHISGKSLTHICGSSTCQCPAPLGTMARGMRGIGKGELAREEMLTPVSKGRALSDVCKPERLDRPRLQGLTPRIVIRQQGKLP